MSDDKRRSALTAEDRKQFRSQRLRQGSNRVVSLDEATPLANPPREVLTRSCRCGAYLQGSEQDFADHERIVHQQRS